MSRMSCVRSMTLAAERLFEVALLGGTEVVVEDDDVGVAAFDGRSEFLHLAAADEGGGFGRRTGLHGALDNHGAGAGGKLGELVQGFLGAKRIAARPRWNAFSTPARPGWPARMRR